MEQIKNSLVDEVVEKIVQKIETRELQAGDKLPSEPTMAKNMLVSRNTIRSALSRLSAMGVIETKHGSGSYIRRTAMAETPGMSEPVGEEELQRIIQLLVFRKSLETGSAYLAAENHTAEQLAEIRAALQDMVDNRFYVQAYGAADTRFHLAIAKASGNKFFCEALQSIVNPLNNHFTEMPIIVGMELNARDHVEVYTAIEQRNAPLAQERMYQLIDRSLNMLLHKIGI